MLQGSTQRLVILAIFRLIPSHVDLSTVCVSFMYRSWYMVNYLCFTTPKYDGWVLIAARAAFRMNRVYILAVLAMGHVLGMFGFCQHHMKKQIALLNSPF